MFANIKTSRAQKRRYAIKTQQQQREGQPRSQPKNPSLPLTGQSSNVAGQQQKTNKSRSQDQVAVNIRVNPRTTLKESLYKQGQQNGTVRVGLFETLVQLKVINYMQLMF